MRFILDECIPVSAAEMLSENGFEVFRITDFVPSGSPDQLVATVAQEQNAILISHDKDFKEYASWRIDGQETRFRKLCVVRMECKQRRIRERLEKSLSHISIEYEDRKKMHDPRLIINVKSDVISIHR